MAFRMRGQGATEYLVLLAAVLIIALVSLALLGFFPGMAGDAKISQSASYWRSEAKPFAILDHSLSGGNLTLVIQLKDATGTFRITNISVGTSTNSSIPAAGKIYNAGETKNVVVYNLPGSDVYGPGDTYEFPINITYVSSNDIPSVQYGSKNLVGKAI